MKNHLGETLYQTYPAWKRACKKKYPCVVYEGNADICQAGVYEDDGDPENGPHLTINSIGEWDGAVGSIYRTEKERALTSAKS